MARITVRKEPRTPGLAGICQGPRGYHVCVNKEKLVTVACEGKNESSWYFYGAGMNSLWTSTTWPTKDAALVAAKEWTKRYLQSQEAKNV